MTNELVFIFRREAIEQLLRQDPDFIVVRSTIEEAVLKSGEGAGVVKVYAQAMRKGEPQPADSVDGCPVPPCVIE